MPSWPQATRAAVAHQIDDQLFAGAFGRKVALRDRIEHGAKPAAADNAALQAKLDELIKARLG